MHWFPAQSRLFVLWGACAAQALSTSSSVAQPAALGPTTSQAMPAATPWPTRPPSRIYVIPFTMDPALQQQLAEQSAPVIPQGPVRSLLESRPRGCHAAAPNGR